jgi:hypothetical protein
MSVGRAKPMDPFPDYGTPASDLLELFGAEIKGAISRALQYDHGMTESDADRLAGEHTDTIEEACIWYDVCEEEG